MLKAAEYGAGLAYQLSYTDLYRLNGVFAPKLFSDLLEGGGWRMRCKKTNCLSKALNGLNAMQQIIRP